MSTGAGAISWLVGDGDLGPYQHTPPIKMQMPAGGVGGGGCVSGGEGGLVGGGEDVTGP